jgi:triacylglycerol esterase/lipase EstA (alpha/beta hydrolase family)
VPHPDPERIAQLTRTVISVSTPHHGTPLSNHFISIQGQTLLLVLSALATSGQGRPRAPANVGTER